MMKVYRSGYTIKNPKGEALGAHCYGYEPTFEKASVGMGDKGEYKARTLLSDDVVYELVQDATTSEISYPTGYTRTKFIIIENASRQEGKQRLERCFGNRACEACVFKQWNEFDQKLPEATIKSDFIETE